MGANGSTGNLTAAVDILVVVVVCAIFILGLFLLTTALKKWKSLFDDRIMKALKRRRTTEDPFREKNGYSWDYLIAFKVYEELEPISELQAQFNMRYILGQLSLGGLEFRLFYSLNHQEVFCKIRCPLERIEKQADLLNFKFLLESKQLKTQLEEGKEGLWEPVYIPESSPMTTISPYDFIYARYEVEEEFSHLYKRWPKKTLNGEIKNNNNDNNIKMSSYINTNESPIIKNPLAKSPKSEKEEVKVVCDSVFRGMDRIKIIHSIISFYGSGGCSLNPYLLVEKECLLCYTPLHDFVEIRDLEDKWIVFFQFPWNQPVDDIRNYFGEKIGLYFVWLGSYTTWLVVAAIVGTGIWINVAVEDNNPSVPAIPYFCGFMGLWSSLFLEYWKRTEKTVALHWGMIGFEDEERVRPSFEGTKILSPVNGAPDIYFSKWQRMKRSLRAYSVVVGVALSIVGIVASIFVIKIVLVQTNVISQEMISILTGIMLSIVIQILNAFFFNYALSLNNYENHRTDTDYEDALIMKTFIFQFFNSYSALFYIAYLQPFMNNIDPCGDCMIALQITLATIFITRLVIGNITELVWPLIESSMKANRRENLASDLRRKSMKSHQGNNNNELNSFNGSDGNKKDEISKHEISEIEKTYMMPEYHVMLGTLEDYSEMAIQFGYTTMFVAAFPLSCLMALVNNYVEIRVDAWKLCQLCRRPEPRSCEDIGTWQLVLEVISYAAVFCNSAIIAYTSSTAVNYTWADRAWIFILIGTGLLVIKIFVAYIIPDSPVEIDIQQKRQEYIVGKIIDNIEDEDDSDLVKGLYVAPTYIVNSMDDDPL